MEIKTKFNIGDKVIWLFKECDYYCIGVFEVSEIKYDGLKIGYDLKSDENSNIACVKENVLYHIDEIDNVLEVLKNDITKEDQEWY